MIRRLEANGLAYQTAAGDVNFSVRKFPGYGKLSGKSLDDLRAGERVDVDGTRTTHSTSSCGNTPNLASLSGLRLGAMADRAGTSNARR
jgi:hypothetical protein